MLRFNFLVYRYFVNVIALGFTSLLFKHINIDAFLTLLIAALILTLLNIFLKPILVLLTLPLQILTFGLFYVVVTAIILKLTASFVAGFNIDGFWAAIGGSLFIGFINLIFDFFSRSAELRFIVWK
ncbi:MAG: phage holin family protein [Deferribacterota bacterium]|nr:phage holin family protein [Deferribacterota bacterium]